MSNENNFIEDSDLVRECITLIKEYDFVLFGIGKEFFTPESEDFFKNESEISKVNSLFEHVNYFIVSTSEYDYFRKCSLNQKRIACPFCTQNSEFEEKQWDLYNKWLSATMGKKLLIFELGENFDNPNIIKWPFERITMINNSAKLYRINPRYYQVPPEIAEKARCINTHSFNFFKKLINL